MKQIVSTSKAPGSVGPYSQAVKANGFVFLSGQIPLDVTTGNLVTGNIQEQATRVLENLKTVLEAAGLSLENVVKSSVFLRDMNDFDAMNETYSKYFPANAPARTTVQVARLPRDVGIEIDVIALDIEA
jgi:2-iminobutanoate/2-iminopropanoate deaminase